MASLQSVSRTNFLHAQFLQAVHVVDGMQQHCISCCDCEAVPRTRHRRRRRRRRPLLCRRRTSWQIWFRYCSPPIGNRVSLICFADFWHKSRVVVDDNDDQCSICATEDAAAGGCCRSHVEIAWWACVTERSADDERIDASRRQSAWRSCATERRLEERFKSQQQQDRVSSDVGSSLARAGRYIDRCVRARVMGCLWLKC
jgi:hypothetical protein